MSSDFIVGISGTKEATKSVDTNVVMKPRGIEVATIREANTESRENNSSADGGADGRDIQAVVKDVSEYVKNIRHQLNFSVEQDLGITVIKVVDSNTNELIRQIPTEEFLDIARALEKTKSLLMKTEV